MAIDPNTRFAPDFAQKNPSLAYWQQSVQQQQQDANNGGGGGIGGGGGGGGGGGNLADQFKLDPVSVKYPAFMPGQMQALAGQLNAGFGGGVGNYTNYLNQVYEPFKFKQYQMPLDGVMGTGGDKKNPFDKKRQPNKWANWNLENQAPAPAADPMQPYGQNWMW
jgi:hypothetical protein